MTSGTKLFKIKKEHVWKKNWALTDQDKSKKLIRSKIKTMTKFFYNNSYSEHFGEITSGTKLFEIKKQPVWKKNWALTDQDNTKKLIRSKIKTMTKFFYNNSYSEHFGEITSGTKLFEIKKQLLWKKNWALTDQDKPKNWCDQKLRRFHCGLIVDRSIGRTIPDLFL